jgi:hypothetical protein
VADRFEIIGDMYVYGFMERQAVERLEQVEIELV